MEIILIRHGEPTFDMTEKVCRNEWVTKLDAYDAAGLKPDSHPPHALHALTQHSAAVFSSHLPRAVESARHLKPKLGIVSTELFREAPLPRRLPLPFPCSVKTGAIITRLLWLMGYAGGAESHRQARQRAIKATQQLIEHARDSERVMLVGHGIFNLFIGRQLISQGWSRTQKPQSCYWGSAVYRYESDNH